MLEGLYDWLLSGGAWYALAGVFCLVIVDAMIFPALPDLFAVLTFLLTPSLWWGIAVLLTVCTAELVGNSALYALVKRKRLPEFLERAMKKWVGFLVLKDERVILMNRFAPIVPYTGAFIATCNWSYRKAMGYLVAGCIAKYTILLAIASALNAALDRDLAFAATVVAIFVILGLSLVSSYYYRRRLVTKQGL